RDEKLRWFDTRFFAFGSSPRELKKLASKLLQPRKMRYKMRSSKRSKRPSLANLIGHQRPTFSPCFSDAGTNNGVEESLSNYSIEDRRAPGCFLRGTTQERCAVWNHLLSTREFSQGLR